MSKTKEELNALLQKLKDYKEDLKQQVVGKDNKLQEVGYKNYEK